MGNVGCGKNGNDSRFERWKIEGIGSHQDTQSTVRIDCSDIKALLSIRSEQLKVCERMIEPTAKSSVYVNMRVTTSRNALKGKLKIGLIFMLGMLRDATRLRNVTERIEIADGKIRLHAQFFEVSEPSIDRHDVIEAAGIVQCLEMIGVEIAGCNKSAGSHVNSSPFGKRLLE